MACYTKPYLKHLSKSMNLIFLPFYNLFIWYNALVWSLIWFDLVYLLLYLERLVYRNIMIMVKCKARYCTHLSQIMISDNILSHFHNKPLSIESCVIKPASAIFRSWPFHEQHGIEYLSVTSSKFYFWIPAFSWPYFICPWRKTLTHQILHESVHGGLRYDLMNT